MRRKYRLTNKIRVLKQIQDAKAVKGLLIRLSLSKLINFRRICTYLMIGMGQIVHKGHVWAKLRVNKCFSMTTLTIAIVYHIC